MAFQVTVAAWPEGGPIPKQYTCDGANVSPAAEWSGEPAGTKSFVLIMDDPDAPAGTWNHWLLYDIPAQVRRIDEGAANPPGLGGVNDFGKPGYGGPCPPRGHGRHRYYLRVFALDTPSLGLKPGARRAEIERAMGKHILARAAHMGVYERK